MDAVEGLRRLGGASRWTGLINCGVNRRAVAAALASGSIQRPLFGTYALPGTPTPVWLAAAYNARLSCISLCRVAGLPLLVEPARVHLVVPSTRARRADDRRPLGEVVLHRSDEIWRASEASPIAAAIDLASMCVDRHAQLALVDAALHDRKLWPAEVAQFSVTPLVRQRWLRDHCDDEAQSIMESYARITLTEAGLSVRPQAVVGRRGHRDLLVENLVVMELDGYDTHGNPRAFRDDRARDRAAVRDGRVPLRYTYADLFGPDPADLVADVEAALRLARGPA